MTREEFKKEFCPRQKLCKYYKRKVVKNANNTIVYLQEEKSGYEFKIGTITCFIQNDKDVITTIDGFSWGLNRIEHLVKIIQDGEYEEYIKKFL